VKPNIPSSSDPAAGAHVHPHSHIPGEAHDAEQQAESDEVLHDQALRESALRVPK
jgi:hypothetical protein